MKNALAVLEALPFAAELLEAERKLPAKLVEVPKFRGAALEAQSINATEWLLEGPAETGKTVAGLWRLDTIMRSTPRAHGVLLRKVHAHMTGTVLETWDRVVAIRGGVEKRGGESPSSYLYPNGSRLQVIGMDTPGRVLSGGLDAIYACQAEELSANDWEYLTSRVTGREAVVAMPMLFGDCNPGHPNHWIKDREKRGSLKTLRSTHRDNPALYDDDGNVTTRGARTIDILSKLTGVRRERLYLGNWAAAEGTVYGGDNGYNRAVHLIERFDIPTDWRRVRVIDFGYTNPFVCQWWAIDPDGRAYRYREIYRTQRLVEDHARDIVALSKGEKIEATIADHDAEDRATLHAHGVQTIAAVKPVTVGIQAVQARLAVQQDGKPRLFLLEDSLVALDESLEATSQPVCTEDEFEVYAWAKGADGRPIKEEPVKLNDHGMDLVRYLAMYLDSHRSTRIARAVEHKTPRISRVF